MNITGTPQADTLDGTPQADTISGLAGNDTLSGATGYDTYVFAPGFGQDVIIEETGSTDGGRIRFEGGITLAGLSFARSSADARDLVITAGADSVRIQGFYDASGNIQRRIAAIEFEAVGERTDLRDFMVGTPQADTFAGASQAETIIGLAGDDTLSGSTGYDTYVFAPGFGNDVIIEQTSRFGFDGGRIRFEGGITLAGLSFARSSADARDLVISAGADSVRIQGFYDASGRVQQRIDRIEFETGAFLDLRKFNLAAPATLDLKIASNLAPGKADTAQLEITGKGAPSSTASPQTYLLAVSAEGGLVGDGLSGAFSDTAFVLARGVEQGRTSAIDVAIKGTAGPLSTLGLKAQLADPAATVDIATRIAALQPSFVEASVASRIKANLDTKRGKDIGDLTKALAARAEQFESFGLNATSATAALAFAIEAAGAFGALAERGQSGALGQGWATLADIGLAIDGESAQLKGLTGINALRALAIDAAALYTVSNSAGRSVALSGDVLALAAPARPVFQEGIDGQFRTAGAFEGKLVRTTDGFRIELSNGDALLFDKEGNFLSMNLGDGRQIVAAHNAAMQITGLSGPNGAGLTFARNADGKLQSIEDADGRTITFAYDSDGRLQTVTRPQGQSSFEYNASGDLASATAPGAIKAEFTYDTLGRLNNASYGSGAQTEDFAYDDQGGLTITDGAGQKTELDLLPGGVVGRVTDGAGGVSRIIYDANGNISGVRAPDGTETGLAFDDQGRLTRITDANGAGLGYAYGETGQRPVSFTDAGGNTRGFKYDAGGRITEATWPDGARLQFEYDGQGNLTGYTNRRGDDIAYTYDARGRLLSKSDSSAGPTTYTYDAEGRLSSATNDQGVTSLTYDSAGRVTQIDYPGGKSLSYTYNAAGLRASMSDGGDYNIFYQYDALGRLTGLRDEDSQIIAYEYDSGGKLTKETNGNGTVSLFTYDTAGRLTRIENQAPDKSVNSFNAYTYDTAGQRLTNETQDGTWTYGYDAIGQLTSAEFVSTNPEINDKSLSYEYDAAGNRTRVVEDGVETLYTANALNQYTRAGNTTFTYDSSGNMTSRTDGAGRTTYSYDLNNRLSSVTQADGTVLSFEYDVFGNRVAKTVAGARTEYLVDPFGLGNVVSEFTGGSLSATYAHGLGLAAAEIGGADAFYDADAVGTVTTLTGARGAVQNRYVFTPFGREVSEVEGLANSFEFNGILGVAEDSAGLTFMRARSYSNELGRFVGEDPLFITGDNENLYRFGFNDPVSFNDPSGEVAPIVLAIYVGAQYAYVGAQYAAAGYAAVAAAATGIRIGSAAMEGAVAYANGDYSDAHGYTIDILFEAAGGLIPGKTPPEKKVLDKARKIFEDKDKIADAIKKHIGEKTLEKVNEEFLNVLKELLKDFLTEVEIDKPLDPVPPISDSDNPDDINPPPPPPPVGRAFGDPHITTFDGLGYSFQAAGEFTLFRTRDGSSEFQVRQEPWPWGSRSSDIVSVNTAIAARLGDATVGVYAGQATPLLINGKAVTLAVGQSIAVGTGAVYFDGLGYTITDESGNGVWARASARWGFLNLRSFLNNDSRGQVEGLLGNADGDPNNDFMLRDGTVLSLPLPATRLYGEYADSWRID